MGVQFISDMKEKKQNWTILRREIIKNQKLDPWLCQFIKEQPNNIIIEKDGLVKRLVENKKELSYIPKTMSQKVAVAIYHLSLHFGSDKMVAFSKHHIVMNNMDRIFIDRESNHNLNTSTLFQVIQIIP